MTPFDSGLVEVIIGDHTPLENAENCVCSHPTNSLQLGLVVCESNQIGVHPSQLVQVGFCPMLSYSVLFCGSYYRVCSILGSRWGLDVGACRFGVGSSLGVHF